MFQLKTKILFGLENIKGITGDKIAIFSANAMIRHGFVDEILEYVGGRSIIIKNIKPEPEEKYIEDYIKKLEKEKPDTIIAIGGGSVIDTAKATLYHYKKANLIAIPSTSGSGSEVTMAAVLAKNGLKYSIVAEHIAPKYAILDERLPMKMDSKLAAYTGMDALSHAIESLVSPLSNPFSMAFSIEASKYIFENLIKSIKGDRNARKNMHYASCMAGISILNARVGICHVMAHKMGIFNIPHGLAIALLLPHTLEYNMKSEEARKKYDMLAAELGMKNAHDLVEKIKEMERNIGIKEMKHYIKEEEFNKKIGIISKEASNDVLLNFNPVKANENEIRQIYEKAWKNWE